MINGARLWNKIARHNGIDWIVNSYIWHTFAHVSKVTENCYSFILNCSLINVLSNKSDAIREMRLSVV